MDLPSVLSVDPSKSPKEINCEILESTTEGIPDGASEQIPAKTSCGTP